MNTIRFQRLVLRALLALLYSKSERIGIPKAQAHIAAAIAAIEEEVGA